MDSILTTIKKMLGIEASDTSFDTDIIININSVFSILYQLGVGPLTAFSISDATATWVDFLVDSTKLELVKSYIYLKVRLIFDPPAMSFVLDAMNRQITEYEWRLNTIAEEGLYVEPPIIPEE